jgi:DNA-binding transcriptional LysR family regulator
MLLRRGLKMAHLRLLAALGATGQMGAAAAQMGITQPAASRLMAEVERISGAVLHQRTGRGLVLTPGGAALARRAAQVLIEIEDAGRELAEIAGGQGGQVRLGAVTGPAMDRVLPAMTRLRATEAPLQVEVVVATSDVLCAQLLAGRLDFALARLPPGDDAARLRFVHLGSEPVRLLVRRGHPLLAMCTVGTTELMAHDWIMPPAGSILHRTVVDRLRLLGLPQPPGMLTTSSFLFTLALLQQSDAIAPLARAVTDRFATDPDAPYVVLPADLGIEVAPYGLITRVGAGLTPAAERVLALVMASPPTAGGVS